MRDMTIKVRRIKNALVLTWADDYIEIEEAFQNTDSLTERVRELVDKFNRNAGE